MTATTTAPAQQRRHEAPAVGDAIVRMLRGLVTRAAEGDTEAVEQLARVERAATVATALGGRLAHDCAGYSYTELAGVLEVTRQAARQRSLRAYDMWGGPYATVEDHPDYHQLLPGHTRRGCPVCASA